MARLPGQLAVLFLLSVAAAWGVVLGGGNKEVRTLEDFAASDRDPCQLESGELIAEPAVPYENAAGLINNVDLVVRAHPMSFDVYPPADGTSAALITTVLRVDELVMGEEPAADILVDSHQRVMYDGERFIRAGVADADLCTADQVLLFLTRNSDGATYRYPAQGWVRISGDTLQKNVSIGEADLFATYGSMAAITDDIRRMAAEQAANDVPKGRLLCESHKHSDKWVPPAACPGDTFNPYESFHLAQPVTEAFVVVSDPGPSPLALSRTDLVPESPQLRKLLKSLNVEVQLRPLALEPDDLLHLGLFVSEAPEDSPRPVFLYSPSTRVVRILGSNGQFDAPQAFIDAMAPFVAQQQEATTD